MTGWNSSAGLDAGSYLLARLTWMAGWERREGTIGRVNGFGGRSTGEREHVLVGLGSDQAGM